MQVQLERALTALTTIDEQDLSELSIEDTVLLGQLLWQIGNLARALFQPIKRRLQYETVTRRGNQPGPVHYSGADGAHCTVRIPPRQVGGRPRVSFD